jgi:hypothetical protein
MIDAAVSAKVVRAVETEKLRPAVYSDDGPVEGDAPFREVVFLLASACDALKNHVKNLLIDLDSRKRGPAAKSIPPAAPTGFGKSWEAITG